MNSTAKSSEVLSLYQMGALLFSPKNYLIEVGDKKG